MAERTKRETDEKARQEARNRAISKMKERGFDILSNVGEGSNFFRLIGVSGGKLDGLRAYYHGGNELLSEAVVGLAAVETVFVTDRQIELGIAERVSSTQGVEPLVIADGAIELALTAGNYLGVAASDEEAMANWKDRLRPVSS